MLSFNGKNEKHIWGTVWAYLLPYLPSENTIFQQCRPSKTVNRPFKTNHGVKLSKLKAQSSLYYS